MFLSRDVLDLRGEIHLDAFGILSLLCKLKDLIKNEDKNIYLLVEDNSFCRLLQSIGFFTELEKSNSDREFFKSNKIDNSTSKKNSGTWILPLHLLGYRGAEKKVMIDLHDPLISQGFSESLSGLD